MTAEIPPIECAPVLATSPWYAVWTHSHCEQTVHEQFLDRGLDSFLPTMNVRSRSRGVKRLIPAPMFSSYLFLRHRIDKNVHLDIAKIKGIVRILGERWDRLSIIPDVEIEALKKVTSARSGLPFPYLRDGQRVRIAAGPLAGIEGVLVESRARQGLLVVSVNLLQRSVAVVIDGMEVTPA